MSDPPYSSVRVLLAGERNCSIRYPLERAEAHLRRARPPCTVAPCAVNALPISAIIGRVISIGMPPTIGLGMGLDDTWVAAFLGRVAEPGW